MGRDDRYSVIPVAFRLHDILIGAALAPFLYLLVVFVGCL